MDRVEPSMFRNAVNTRIENGSFTINNIRGPSDGTLEPLNKLYEQVATNAILNAGGRVDEVKCYPGTREEVIGLVERWMDAQDNAAQKIMWLSGPAGAGKSAIVQTIAERCRERGVHAASFFFFRGDPTRSTARPLVATLLYQILKFYPPARQAAATALSDDPLLFSAPVKDQFIQLLSSPLQNVLPPFGSSTRQPIVLLIDGLDECDSKHNISHRQILRALDHLVMQNDSPFLALVASRDEPQIAMALKQLSSSIQFILLGEQYAPEKDSRVFVTGEISKIEESHYLPHTLGNHQSSDENTASTAKKLSDQFGSAATVIRWVAFITLFTLLSVIWFFIVLFIIYLLIYMYADWLQLATNSDTRLRDSMVLIIATILVAILGIPAVFILFKLSVKILMTIRRSLLKPQH